jgi:hypothetical protein
MLPNASEPEPGSERHQDPTLSSVTSGIPYFSICLLVPFAMTLKPASPVETPKLVAYPGEIRDISLTSKKEISGSRIADSSSSPSLPLASPLASGLPSSPILERRLFSDARSASRIPNASSICRIRS